MNEKKLLFIDVDSSLGHINYNRYLLKSIQRIKCLKIDTVFHKNYEKKLSIALKESSRHFSIPDNLLIKAPKRNGIFYKISYRYKKYRTYKWVFKISNKYDYLLFTSIEPLSFSMASKFNRQSVIFLDHSIATVSSNRIKRLFWKQINSKYIAMVMEQYIKEYLQRIKIKNEIIIIPHPIPEINFVENHKNKIKTNDMIIFAPSESNDEMFIDELIKKSNEIKNYKIIIRSSKQKYKSENLEVYNNRISDELYYFYIFNSQFILLPYDENYNFRVSGVFFEAIMAKKKCLINSNNTLSFYKNQYPKITEIFNSVDGFLDLLKDKIYIPNDLDFFEIKSEHSSNAIATSFEKIINRK